MGRPRAGRPNILLICSDQHNPTVSGCYGDGIAATPNLDELARGGLVYTNAYCNAPLCVPSRMSMLTGRQPHRIGVLHNGDVLDSRIPTFAHMAAGAGYRTVLAGRMHFVGPDQLHGFQERIGSDYTAYAFHCGKINAYKPLEGLLGNAGRPDPLLEVGAGGTATQEMDRDTTRASTEWLEQYAASSRQHPFLMTVGYFSPHCPYIAEECYYAQYADRVTPRSVTAEELRSLHPYHLDYRRAIELDRIPAANLSKATAAYYGLVSLLDEQVGMLLAALAELGLDSETTIMYVSDHGEMLGEHGRWHKQSFYEGSARVPLIMQGPQAPATGECHGLVSLVDLFPTLCDMVGAKPGISLDGQSLFTPVSPDRTVLSEHYGGQHSHRMVRRGNYKLNVYGGYETGELYDLGADPKELATRWDDPAYSSVQAALLSAMTADGWSHDVAVRHQAELDELGFQQVRAAAPASQALIEAGILTDVPGYCWEVGSYRNWLDQPAVAAISGGTGP